MIEVKTGENEFNLSNVLERGIDILGTKYEIVITDKEQLDQLYQEGEADGICCVYDRKIFLRKMDDMLSGNDSKSAKYIRFCETARHELIHAFFKEAGLTSYCDNEELVDWMAILFPKMLEAFEKMGIARV